MRIYKEAPPEEKVTYLVLDFARNKESYSHVYYCENGMDYFEFDAHIKNSIESIKNKILRGDTIVRDYDLMRFITAYFELNVLQEINLSHVYWNDNDYLVNNQNGVDRIVFEPAVSNHSASILVLQTFDELNQASFKRFIYNGSELGIQTIEQKIEKLKLRQDIEGFSEFCELLIDDPDKIIGYHSAFFGLSASLSNYWSELIGEICFQKIIENGTRVLPKNMNTEKNNITSHDDSDLPF